MVSFRKKSNASTESTDAENLLAKKKRGLFGRNNKNNDRSDADNHVTAKSARTLSPFKRRKNDLEQAAAGAEPAASTRRVTMAKARSAPGGKNTKSSRGLSPFKRRFNNKDAEQDELAETPPVTPEKATDDAADAADSPLQVKVVTVKAQSSPGREKVDGETEEDVTVMSDLTDNRTYKRLADYKQSLAKEQDAAAAAAAIAAESELAAIPEEKQVANVKARMEHVQAAQAAAGGVASSSSTTPQSEGVCGAEGDNNLNPVAYILSYMDNACKPPQTGASSSGINKSYSFVPEWGMAPSRDERDKRTGAAAMVSDDEDMDDDDDDDTTRQGPSPTPQQHRAVKDEVHENFEMVLEDLQSTEDVLAQKKQQQRNWMGAMSFRKNGDKEGNHHHHQEGAGAGDQQDKVNSPPPPPPRRTEVPSTIKKSGKNRANVSPLTVEEEKKEDDMDEEEPRSGARKMGNKILKSFRRLKNLKGDLPPVTEDDEYETGPPETSELQVRVPDNMKTLTEQDLIGDQVVHDIYRDLEASEGSNDNIPLPDAVKNKSPEKNSEPKQAEENKERLSSPQSHSVMDSTIPSKDQTYDEDDESTNVDGEPPSTNMISSFMSLLTGSNNKELPDEVRDIPEKGDIPKSKSWVDQFRFTMSEDTHEAPSISPSEKLDRQRSAPYREMNQKHRKIKQMWREASDPKTGRSYYYHRITREVTWKKPQEMIDFEEQEKEDAQKTKDKHRQLLSVLSDGDLAAAAERTKRGKAEAAMRKKNARDFDPRIWSTKEEVVKLLQTMAPPDGSSVEQVLKQYEGREEILLQQLREMKAAKPFDEPVADDDEDTVPSQRAQPPPRSKSVPRVRSTPAVIKKTSSFKNAFSRRSPKVDKKDSTKTPQRGEVKRPDPEEATPRMSRKSRAQTEDADRAAQAKASEKLDEGSDHDKPKKKKKPDSPTRNVARAVRARLAARRARDAAAQAVAQEATQAAGPLEPEGLGQPQEDEIEEAELNMNSSRRSDKENSGALDRAEPNPNVSAALHSPISMSGRVRTSGSGVTKISEKTEVIRNTAKRSPLGTVGELRSTASDATSLSSTGLEPRLAVSTTTAASKTLPIPGKITAPRTRELMVEEFSSSTDRAYKAEVYDKKRTVRAGRFGTTGTRRRKPFTTPSPHYQDGDDSTKTDSVSALSMEDTKPNYPIPPQFGSKGGVDDARRRALDDAIAREDWDLAAALSDAMRAVKTQPAMPPRQQAGWKQSELDRFISQNDWDAVANYIATVRAKTKRPAAKDLTGLPPRSANVGRAPINAVDALTPPPNTRRLTRRRHQSPELFDETDEIMGGNPKKRFGAKSQLQHGEIQSESSYDSEESSYYSDDYSSSSTYSEPSRGKNRYRYASKHSLPIKNKKGGGRPKEFAC